MPSMKGCVSLLSEHRHFRRHRQHSQKFQLAQLHRQTASACTRWRGTMSRLHAEKEARSQLLHWIEHQQPLT